MVKKRFCTRKKKYSMHILNKQTNKLKEKCGAASPALAGCDSPTLSQSPAWEWLWPASQPREGSQACVWMDMGAENITHADHSCSGKPGQWDDVEPDAMGHPRARSLQLMGFQAAPTQLLFIFIIHSFPPKIMDINMTKVLILHPRDLT